MRLEAISDRFWPPSFLLPIAAEEAGVDISRCDASLLKKNRVSGDVSLAELDDFGRGWPFMEWDGVIAYLYPAILYESSGGDDCFAWYLYEVEHYAAKLKAELNTEEWRCVLLAMRFIYLDRESPGRDYDWNECPALLGEITADPS